MLVQNQGVSYEQLRQQFRWTLPGLLNMGAVCSDFQRANALALIEVAPDGTRREYSFGDLRTLSNKLANGLRGIGIANGDRVGIVLPQRLETGLAHLAIYKLGAIAVPMSVLFGPQALMYRLGDSAASAVITDSEHLESVVEVAAEVGQVQVIVVDAEPAAPHRGFWNLIEAGSGELSPAATSPDTPALLIYTSGTTGAPKGALHGHRVLFGHLPGFELSNDFFPQDGDRFWTPADWAWIGGLMDALMPTWHHGRPVVCAPRHGFDPEWALRLMVETGVRNTFLPPTALKMMRQANLSHPRLTLRSVISGGESLGDEMLAWARETLGVTVNEFYGQTEVNFVVGNSANVWDVRAGSMGRPYPGHDVSILGADGLAAAVGEVGEIAVKAPDPVMFLGYWGRPDATREKFSSEGRWLRTGDLARVDSDGYFWFQSRSDDVINSAGYRIGPAEIETCLMRHPAVAMAAVIGIRDDIRGEAVKAYVVLRDGQRASRSVETGLRDLVRESVAAYAYPRDIAFVPTLPLTATGKIRRGELRRMEAQGDSQASPS